MNGGTVWRQLAVGLLAAVLVVPVLAGPAHAAEPHETAPLRLLVTLADAVDAAAFGAGMPHAHSVDPPSTPTRVQVLELADRSRLADVLAALTARADVVAVEPDLPLTPGGTLDRILDVVVTAQHVAPLAATADHDLLSAGGAGALDVGALEAWPMSTGRDVVVAVIDSGVDISHPLLRDHVWRNPGERVSGRDDDGNGFVDDIHGWNFVDGDAHVFRSEQLDHHGTHVAGIIAGSAYPPGGFAGVAPGVRIMSLRFIAGGAGRSSDAIAALRYAEANGADVANASWGGPTPDAALRAVLSELTIPVVLAAGNEGLQPGAPVGYPAAYGLPNTISVAALDLDGSLAAFSSRDRTVVDVAAPGTRIVSTYPGSRLAEASGTSQAAPKVTGVLALALARHPDLDPIEVAAAVRASVRPLAGAAETRSGGLARAPALLDLLGTGIRACPTGLTVPFADVTPGGAHHDAVACLLARRVTRGTGPITFGSADGLTRGQIASLLVNALEPTGRLPVPPAGERFSDTANTTHRDSIERLDAIGVALPAAGDRFDPQGPVTRADFAAMVVRAADWLHGAPSRARGPVFTDTRGHPDAAAIDAAAGLRIVTGRSPGVFDPDAALRRDQAASMVARLLDRLVQHGLLAT